MTGLGTGVIQGSWGGAYGATVRISGFVEEAVDQGEWWSRW
jgi:hypothetical protein